jgi:hypothetical protein
MPLRRARYCRQGRRRHRRRPVGVAAVDAWLFCCGWFLPLIILSRRNAQTGQGRRLKCWEGGSGGGTHSIPLGLGALLSMSNLTPSASHGSSSTTSLIISGYLTLSHR